MGDGTRTAPQKASLCTQSLGVQDDYYVAYMASAPHKYGLFVTKQPAAAGDESPRRRATPHFVKPSRRAVLARGRTWQAAWPRACEAVPSEVGNPAAPGYRPGPRQAPLPNRTPGRIASARWPASWGQHSRPAAICRFRFVWLYGAFPGSLPFFFASAMETVRVSSPARGRFQAAVRRAGRSGTGIGSGPLPRRLDKPGAAAIIATWCGHPPSWRDAASAAAPPSAAPCSSRPA